MGMKTINLDLFNPNLRKKRDNVVMIYVGRVSNCESLLNFLKIHDDLGEKYVIGNGPQPIVDKLSTAYASTSFTEYESEAETARQMAIADVLVCPKDETAMLEANACGTPVAATPDCEASKYVVDHLNGVVDDDIELAIINAVTLDRNKVRQYAEGL